MAGIINDTAAPPQAAPNPAPDATQSPDATEGMDSEQPNVSPEEQKVYDTVVTGALNQIYSDSGFPAVIQKLQNFKDRPAYAIGHTAAMILMSAKNSAQKSGKTIPDDVLFAAGQEVVGDLAKIAQGVGIIPPDQAESIIEPAFYEGMKVWGQSMQDKGEITPEMQQGAKDELAASGHQLPAGAAQPPAGGQAPAQAPPTPAPAGGIVNQAQQ